MLIRAWVFLVFCAFPAFGQNTFPALYQLDGIPAGDVLNIRAGAGTQHDIIDHVPEDTTFIEIIRTNETGTWGLTPLQERMGWVSMHFLRRLSPHPGVFPELLKCGGTEPFWSLELDLNPFHDTGSFYNPMIPDGQVLFVERFVKSPNNTRIFAAITHEDEGKEYMQQGFIQIEYVSCSDGMSDLEYGLSITMMRPDNQLWAGCCSLK